MSEEAEQDDIEEAGGIDESLILELNFVPQWARRPPGGEMRYGDRAKSDAGRRRGRERGARDQRRESRRDRLPGDGRDYGRQPGRPPVPGGRQGSRFSRAEPVEMPRVRIRFLPEQDRLSAVARKIHSTRRAYPVVDLAGLVLSGTNSCYVKIETPRGEDGPSVYQCKTCRLVALDKEQLMAHALSSHLGDFFEKEEHAVDAPSGEFVCVARCGLSGVLLGPPNHHSYAAKVQETHKTRFAHMPLDEYRRRIDTVRDKEAIDRWKEESRLHVTYRLKGDGKERGGALQWAEADEHFRQRIVPSLVARVKNASLPLAVARSIEDPRLQLAFGVAWRRERRAPSSMLFALRAAFSHMRLYVFKAGANAEFVATVRPAPLDPAHTIEAIREVLVYLKEHPGCKRDELVCGLRPDLQPGDSVAAKVLSPLSWLIERGHIIEFFDGSLSVPLSGSVGKRRRRVQRRG